MAFPAKHVKISMDEMMGPVIAECNRLGVKVVSVVADAPKRASLRQTLQFNGTYGKHVLTV
jgi:hypothetical protein